MDWPTLAVLVSMALLPPVVSTPYLLHTVVMVGLYAILALSYDLIVGQVGMLSLAHPTFFGIGAYVAAILALKTGAHLTFPVLLLISLCVALIGAYAIGIPSFRLSLHSFAIGTLGFALVAEMVANNWLWLTEGPMCLTPVPGATFSLPFIGRWTVDHLLGNYYLMIVLVALTVVVYRAIVHSRVGRAFRAVREGEPLAMSVGIDPLRYKMVAFLVGAALAAVAGTFYAGFAGVVCPTELSMLYTNSLLVIMFVGGAGHFRGVVLGAVLFTVLPEMLRISPSWRMILYGVLLLVMITYMPGGLDGLIDRLVPRRSRQRATDMNAAQQPTGGGGVGTAGNP